MKDHVAVKGVVLWELRSESGEIRAMGSTSNLVTAVGDQLYASRGAGLTSSAVPNGMKLGSGSTTPAKTGSGSALTTYLSGANKGFDATYPQAAAGVVTYQTTYAAGQATTASPITEVALVTDSGTDATSSTANTVARALLSGIPSKSATDTLKIVWVHTLAGS